MIKELMVLDSPLTWQKRRPKRSRSKSRHKRGKHFLIDILLHLAQIAKENYLLL